MDEIFDRHILEELQLIMAEDFPVLMDTFLNDSLRLLNEIEKDWQDNDMDSLHRNAHSLKGSCSNVGATSVQKACAKLESCARHGEQCDLPELVADVSSKLQLFCDALRAL